MGTKDATRHRVMYYQNFILGSIKLNIFGEMKIVVLNAIVVMLWMDLGMMLPKYISIIKFFNRWKLLLHLPGARGVVNDYVSAVGLVNYVCYSHSMK